MLRPTTLPAAVSSCFRRWADFSGTSGRAEYWWFWFFTVSAQIIVGLALILIDPTGISAVLAVSLISAAVLIPGLAVFVRRIRDAGLPLWIIAVGFLIPFSLPIFLLMPTDSRNDESQPENQQSPRKSNETQVTNETRWPADVSQSSAIARASESEQKADTRKTLWLAVGTVLVVGAAFTAIALGTSSPQGSTSAGSSTPTSDRATVPDVRGMTASAARDRLDAAGFRVNLEYSGTAAPSRMPERVDRQVPFANSEAPTGSRVTIVLFDPQLANPADASPGNASASTPWYPDGYFQISNEFAYRFSSNQDSQNCSAQCVAWAIDVVSRDGCPTGIAATINVKYDGTLRDSLTDLRYLRLPAGEPVRLEFELFNPYGQGEHIGEVIRISCFQI